jgi:lysophospholipase L1-like esterase
MVRAKAVTGGLGLAGAVVLLGLLITGRRIGWGPFAGLRDWEPDVSSIESRYDPLSRKGEIVFYGMSNFTLWHQLDDDFPQFRVQNHGFGGSTDELLVKYADRLLYPYEPAVVVFQTGSNDYVNMTGSDDEKLERCMANKREMYQEFHEKLPNAKFVVMSGLLLPGRSEYTPLTQCVNEELAALCAEHADYMTFVDASELTFNGSSYRMDLFRDDKIHLNHTGELAWRDGYTLPALEQVAPASCRK